MRLLLDVLERSINTLSTVGAVIGGFFTGVMTLIVGYAVLARYVLNSPIGWSEEISMYLMVWAVFLGASYTLKEDAHIGVDVLISRLGPKTKKAFQSFHYIVGLAFFSILLVKGVEMVQFSLFMGSRSIAVEFPLYIAHLSVPVGSVLLLLQCLQKLIFLYRRKS
jgi:C4-dicarboxylate transporter DctQ subunit